MNLEEFVRLKRAELTTFLAIWTTGHAKNAREFPWIMTKEKWEQALEDKERKEKKNAEKS